MVDGETLQVIADAGGHLEYYGSDDPRWSKPQTIEAFKKGQGPQGMVVMVPTTQQPNPKFRPATFDEVVRSNQIEDYQRVLQGTDEAGNTTYFVVDALYRSPWDRKEEGDLRELPPDLPITLAEMEILGPWLGLNADELVSAIRPSELDSDLSDGKDYIFATKYDWSSYDSVKALRDNLINLLKVKNGKEHNINGWSTDIDEMRLGFLLGFVEARYEDLRVQSGRLHDGEKLWDGLLNGTGFFIPGVAAGALVYTIKLAKDGNLLPGVIGFLTMLKTSGGWLWSVFVRVITTPKLLGGKEVLRFLWNYGGPAAAALLGSILGGKVVEKGTKLVAGGDPNAVLMVYADEEGMRQGFEEVYGDNTFSDKASVITGGVYYISVVGSTSGAKSYRDRLAKEGPSGPIDLLFMFGPNKWALNWFAEVDETHEKELRERADELVQKSNKFGDDITDKLVAYMRDSIDKDNQQIDWREVQQKVTAFYKNHKEYVDRNYGLLDYTAHRSTRGQRIREIIASDGTIINQDVMREYLRKAIEGRLRKKTQKLIRMAEHRGLRVGLKGTEAVVHTMAPYTDVQQAYVDALQGDPGKFYVYDFDDANMSSAISLAEAIGRYKRYLHFLSGGGITQKPVVAEESEESNEPTDDEMLGALGLILGSARKD